MPNGRFHGCKLPLQMNQSLIIIFPKSMSIFQKVSANRKHFSLALVGTVVQFIVFKWLFPYRLYSRFELLFLFRLSAFECQHLPHWLLQISVGEYSFIHCLSNDGFPKSISHFHYKLPTFIIQLDPMARKTIYRKMLT